MRLATITLCALLTGCQAVMYGTGADLNSLSVGMPRAEVVQKLGPPLSTDAKSNNETLRYRRMETSLGWLPTSYVVNLEDGKVVSFGKETD